MAAIDHPVFCCPAHKIGLHRPGRQLTTLTASVERIGTLDLIKELGSGSYGQIYTAVQNYGSANQVTVGKW
jgi:hypothetical protein